MMSFNPHYKACGFWYMDRVAEVEISNGARLTLRHLLRFAGHDGQAYPAVETLADRIGKSVRQVQRYLRELEIAGLVRRVKRVIAGKRTSNLFSFLWVDSLFGRRDVTTKTEPVSPKETLLNNSEENTQNEPRPRFAQRESASASPATDLLEPLREAMQTAHSEVGQRPSVVTPRTAAEMHSRLCEAVGKPVSIQEAAGMVDSLKRHGWSLRPNKRWLWVSGMIAYAYNYFAAADKQTAAYRPEVEMPGAQPFTARTAFHDAADDLFEVAMA